MKLHRIAPFVKDETGTYISTDAAFHTAGPAIVNTFTLSSNGKDKYELAVIKPIGKSAHIPPAAFCHPKAPQWMEGALAELFDNEGNRRPE